MIGLDDRPRRRQELLSQQADDTRILLDPEDGSYYALDEVSGRIWDLLDGRPVAAIVAAVCEEYDAPAATVEADVLAFLAEMDDEGLLEGT